MFLIIITFLYYTTVASVLFCYISSKQLTRAVLIATVKDVCWENNLFCPRISPLLITLEITRLIVAKKRKNLLLKIYYICTEQKCDT